MKRSYRRHRNPQGGDKEQEPFFNKSKQSPTNTMTGNGTFFQTKLTIGRPGDKYEKEADSVADAVVNNSGNTSEISRKEISSIQRESLATPLEDEKLGTAEQRMEEDKLVQEQPELQKMDENKEEPELQQKCDECEKEEKPGMVQQKANSPAAQASPQLTGAIQQTKGKGRPISPKVRAEMESGLGTDLKDVSIHTSANAVELNKELQSQAFTHGNDIYFNSGKYRPESTEGKRLLAHELTHVIQQGKAKKKIQRFTCSDTSGTSVPRAAQGQPNRLDTRANTIIGIASNSNYSNQEKATRLITAIVCHYFNSDADKIRNITYEASEPGLGTTSVGRGNSTKGDIAVGDYFIQNTTTGGFARRVLQVGHEIEHINQYRSGLTGSGNKDEREFLAFHQEALADEFEGTGRMSRGTRRNLIDGALGYYYCLDQAKQTTHETKKQALLTKRQAINDTAGSGPTPEPTTCSRQ